MTLRKSLTNILSRRLLLALYSRALISAQRAFPLISNAHVLDLMMARSLAPYLRQMKQSTLGIRMIYLQERWSFRIRENQALQPKTGLQAKTCLYCR
jgi:hypothetical protein